MSGPDENVEISEVQTGTLRKLNRSMIVRATKAIRATGVEEGAFEFYPESVEELGMLVAMKSDEAIDARSDPLVRTVHREGEGGKTLGISFPREGLQALEIDPDTIDWDDPPEFSIWAGDGVLGFELAAKQHRSVAIGRDRDQDEQNADDE